MLSSSRAMYNISLMVSHVSVVDNNVADLLSRWQFSHTDNQKLSKYISNSVWFSTHIDLLALNDDI